MPELPEVEIAVRNIRRWWGGKSASEVVVIDDKPLEETDPEALVEALRQEVVRIDRRGKYIVVEVEDGHVVLFHFRMTGKIIKSDGPEPDYARLAWQVPDTGWLVFKDQRRLGRVRLLEPGEFEEYEPVQKMGPDALEVSGEELCELLPQRRMLKAALLDQEVIAGLGNIATCEIMWRMKLAPRVSCGELSDEDCDRLAQTIREFIEHVIEVEDSDEIVYLEESQENNPFDVYLREGEPCPRCDTEIERVKVSGRSTYYCPNCQGQVEE